MKIRIILSAAAALLVSAVIALAGNTTFFSSTIGDITFPFSPPTNSGATPGTIDNMTIGATTPAAGTFTNLKAASLTTTGSLNFISQGAPTAATVSATLTAAQLQTGIITVLQGGGAASNQQLPLATAMDTAFPNAAAGTAFDFSVINLSSTALEIANITTNTGWTLVGTMAVAAIAAGVESQGRFRARKTGTGAWVLYRIS